jgi:hypothetical protein
LGCVEGDHLSTFAPSSLELEGEEVATAADDISKLTGIIDVALSSTFPDEMLKTFSKTIQVEDHCQIEDSTPN